MYWNRDVILSETFFQLRDTLTILLHSLYDREYVLKYIYICFSHCLF